MAEPASEMFPAPAFTLEAHAAVGSAKQAAAFAKGLDALRPPSGAVFCPADFGQYVVAWFGYASGAVDPVTIDVGGCGIVTNGHLSRASTGGTVVEQLLGLVPAPRPASARVELRLCGGPAPGECRISSVTTCGSSSSSCAAADRAVLVGTDGVAAATLTLDSGRSATTVVIPGSYTVRLLEAAPGAQTRTLQTKQVTLRPGSQTTIVFTIDAP
jgi:hypothetical protein